MPLDILTGNPHPLGATLDSSGVANFALYSQNAEAVDLCLFEPGENGEADRETARIRLSHCTNDVFHVGVSGLEEGQLYGYRVHGRWNPVSGAYFNPAKLLIDPRARAINGATQWHETMAACRVTEPKQIQTSNSAPHLTKSVLLADRAYDWEGVEKPGTAIEDSVFYEVHVKGFTQLHPDVPKAIRGSYAGLASDASIKYLTELGITAIQLLPVHHRLDDDFLLAKGLVNYWGYNSIGFFAPEARYSASGTRGEQVDEFRDMVKAMHRAGIEVILDVVYNHTGESSPLGPTCCFRGVDNQVYYTLDPKHPQYYYDVTGTGSTVNVPHPATLAMVMDSLRYWSEEMGVDGFRFDLAVAVAREPRGFFPDAAFFKAVHQDPVLSRVKMIAEPWDLGDHGYQVGGFPIGWSELNGRYRDSVRQFWKGDRRVLGEFAARITGSEDIYHHSGRGPAASVNFITSHDGFPLADLVAYNDKHNEANGEGNRDGDNHNLSWNHGAEGHTDETEIIELRARQRRNFLATVFLSQGAPFLLGGDERVRSQGGNNNAYCQDNEINWFQWTNLDPDAEAQIEFVRRLIAFRKRHPILRKRTFFSGQAVHGGGFLDTHWFDLTAKSIPDSAWHADRAGAFALIIHREAADHGTKGSFARERESLLLIFSAREREQTVNMPGNAGTQWTLVIDTALDTGFAADPGPQAKSGNRIKLLDRHLQVWTTRDELDSADIVTKSAPVDPLDLIDT